MRDLRDLLDAKIASGIYCTHVVMSIQKWRVIIGPYLEKAWELDECEKLDIYGNPEAANSTIYGMTVIIEDTDAVWFLEVYDGGGLSDGN